MHEIKKNCLLILTSLFSAISIVAQVSTTAETLVIFGTDCSLVTIVTKKEYDPQVILKSDIPRLNLETIKCCNKFKQKFWTKEILIDTADVTRINSHRSANSLLNDTPFVYTDGDKHIREVLKNYSTTAYVNATGEGLLFVMEEINERTDQESFYILVFDLQSKKIIHCDKMIRPLSVIKDKIGSGWFSWKTGIYRTLEAMDDIYIFWNTFPEKEK
jgi:hypothetical protein